jgi:hypothetical protein
VKKVRSHVFNDVEYSIEWEKIPSYFGKNDKGEEIEVELYGLCDHPSEEDPIMTINDTKKLKTIFRTCLHEALHAQFFDKLTEEEITRADEDIGTFLLKVFKVN